MSQDVFELGNTLAPLLGIGLAALLLSIPTWAGGADRSSRQDDEDRQYLARCGRDRPLGPEHYPAEWERNE